MAKNIYIGVGGKARKINNIYIGISGKARKVKKVYIGVGGKARLCYEENKEPREACLTFSSPNTFSINTANAWKNWDGTLEYSTDKKNWKTWNGEKISSVAGGSGYVLYLSGTGNTKIVGNSSSYAWVLTGTNISCSGNIETLLDYATVESGNHPTMAEYCYFYMFSGCTSLTQAPALPATTLASSCYYAMFNGCTSLTQAPALPATTLASGCYCSMFEDCTGLTQAPSLPATTLASSCYSWMFYGCTSLTKAPSLPATTLADNCYNMMFHGCTSLTQVPSLPATTLANRCYASMFEGCTKIKFSKTKTGEYTQAYRIPKSGTGRGGTNPTNLMFYNTGGIFKTEPNINTTYYLSNTNTIV